MPEQVGKYILEGLVAEGGMAQIYRAKVQGLGGIERVLAIKRLRPHIAADQDFVAMLVEEARLAIQLNHQNICQVFDLERHDDQYFIAMEFIQGRDLSQLIQRFSRNGELMPIELALYIAAEVCNGLSYAHRKCDPSGSPLNIVHRDIGPQNILLSYEGEVKIVDFGIAKATLQSSLHDNVKIKGKFPYMSPEQARGERVDPRTDVFSVGATLYEMITGHLLYEDPDDDAHVMKLARLGQFIPPREHDPSIPLPIEKIILRALARDLNQRFQSAHELRLALSAYLHTLPSPCDSLRLAQVMEQLFPDRQRNEVKTPASVTSLRRNEYQLDQSSIISETVRSSIHDDTIPSILQPLEQLRRDDAMLSIDMDTVMHTPQFEHNVDLFAEGIDTNDDVVAPEDTQIRGFTPHPDALDVAETILDIKTPSFTEADRQSRRLKRASLPEQPKAPSLDIDRSNYQENTRLNLPTDWRVPPTQAKTRPHMPTTVAPPNKMSLITTILLILIAVMSVLALSLYLTLG